MTQLRNKYPEANIYGEETQQGFERPAFYIQLIPEKISVLNCAHVQKEILVEICYFAAENTGPQKRDMWDIADEVEDTLGLSLSVGDRDLFINDPKAEITNQVLHYKFKLNFTDSRDGITVAMDTGGIEMMLPDAELGYIDGNVFPMRNIELKEE
jgi:hypothetical protein